MSFLAVSGVNLGHKRSRLWLCILLAFVSCYYSMSYYNYQDIAVIGEDEMVNTAPFVSGSQCQSMFTITPQALPDDERSREPEPWTLKSITNKFFTFSGLQQNDHVEGDNKVDSLRNITMALAIARLGSIADTEIYKAISEYLPSLLIPALTFYAKKSRFSDLSTLREYSDVITARNMSAYEMAFLNKTNGYVPPIRMMSEVPKNPFSFGPSKRSPVKLISEKFDVVPHTRLTQNEGRLPYVPCQVRFYSLDDVKRCSERRRDRNATTWLSFVGDSKSRSRFEQVLEATVSLNWKVFMFGKEITWQYYDEVLRPSKGQVNLEAYATEAHMKASIVWTSQGDITKTLQGMVPITQIVDWLKEGADLPDVVVVGFGVWIYRHMFILGASALAPNEKVMIRWRAMRDIVTRLAAKTTVLLLPQTRFRTYHLKKSLPPIEIGREFLFWWRDVLYKHTLFDHANDWIDKVMLHFTKGTGAIVWDSTFPMNLANVRECGLLKQAQQEDHPAYRDVMLCHDLHHASPPTLHDELMMMLNLLCNKDLDQGSNYCCGGNP